MRGQRLEDVRRWKMNRPPLCCWADPASMGAARVTEVKNDINMACQCVIYYIYWNIYYRAVRFLSKKMIIRCSSWKNKYCFYLSQNNLVAIEVFKCYVLLTLRRLKFFKFCVCLRVLRVNTKYQNYFISSVLVSGVRVGLGAFHITPCTISIKLFFHRILSRHFNSRCFVVVIVGSILTLMFYMAVVNFLK